VTLRDGRRVALRAARPDDASAVQRFVHGLSAASRRNRFFGPLLELSPDQLERVTRWRGPHEVALVAESADAAVTRIVALAQYVWCERLDAEFAVVVDDTYQRQGLGIRLISMLAQHAARARLAALAGFVLADNWPMLTLLARLGFDFLDDGDPRVIRVTKALDAQGLAV
jgi:acetyltransferase